MSDHKNTFSAIKCGGGSSFLGVCFSFFVGGGGGGRNMIFREAWGPEQVFFCSSTIVLRWFDEQNWPNLKKEFFWG